MINLGGVGPSYEVSSGQGTASTKPKILGDSQIELGKGGRYNIETNLENATCSWAIFKDGKDITETLLGRGLTISPDGKSINFNPPEEGKYKIEAKVTDERGRMFFAKPKPVSVGTAGI